VVKVNENTNAELRAEISRLIEKLDKREEIVIKYKDLKVDYRQLLQKLEKSEMSRREL
jgi:hypothetical protein